MQKKLQISQIVWLGFGTVFLLMGLVNLVYLWSTNTLTDSVRWVIHTNTVKLDLKDLEKNLVDAETGQRGFIFTNQERFLEPYNKADEKINDNFTKLREEVKDNPLQLERLARVEDLAQQKMDELAETISLKRAGKEQALRDLVNSGKGKQIMDDVRANLGEMAKVEEELLVERQKAATQAQNISTNLAVGGIILVLGVGLLISFIVTRILTHSLNVALGVAERVSEGDLTTPIEVASMNEIGRLLAALKIMTENLNSLIRQVQQSGIQISTSTTQIAASGKQLEATMTEQVASTHQVVATAKEIAVTSEGLVKTMDTVASMSAATTSAASGGQKDLVRMESTMAQLTEATRSISSKLGVISEKANNISSVIITITKVADQTNLLSLNAAIEAEKAGEYGLGFGVVAREIRRLADQTAVATLDIEQMVKEMLSAVSTGVMEMDRFTQEVGRSVEDVRNISGQLAQIIEQVQALTPGFQIVNQGMEAQSESALQISEVMIQLNEASVQTADSLRQTNTALEQLTDAAQGLRGEISRFKVNA